MGVHGYLGYLGWRKGTRATIEEEALPSRGSLKNKNPTHGRHLVLLRRRVSDRSAARATDQPPFCSRRRRSLIVRKASVWCCYNVGHFENSCCTVPALTPPLTARKGPVILLPGFSPITIFRHVTVRSVDRPDGRRTSGFRSDERTYGRADGGRGLRKVVWVVQEAAAAGAAGPRSFRWHSSRSPGPHFLH